MVVEKQQGASPTDKDAARLEAIRMRLLSNEWADSSVAELMQAIARLHTLPLAIPQHEFESQVALALVHLDRFAAAAQAAATFNNVIAEERSQLASDISQGRQQIREEEQQVQRLREKLQREKNQVDRRAQYDALAKLILDCPPCEKSEKQLEEVQKEANIVGENMEHLEDTKDAVRKELLLLSHCVAGLEDSTKTLTALASDQGNRPTDRQDAMDASL